MDPESILIIRTGGLGDTLLLWPALAGLRRRFPRSRIDLMGHRERCGLLVVPGGGDQALDVEGTGLHLLFEISASIPPEVRARFGSYQAVVVFAAPGDYALPENLSACGVGEVHAFLPEPPAADAVHVADHALRALEGVDMAVAGETPPLPITGHENEAAAGWIQRLGLETHRFAVVAPGSGSSEKNWSPARYARLAGWLADRGLQPVVLEGPADHASVAAMRGHLHLPAAVLACDDLAAVKGVLARASLVVGNDTGTTHLAALAGVPTVAVFGPTDPQRWGLRGTRAQMVTSGAACAPCDRDARHACEERVCLDRIATEEVQRACLRLI